MITIPFLIAQHQFQTEFNQWNKLYIKLVSLMFLNEISQESNYDFFSSSYSIDKILTTVNLITT